MLKGRFDVRIVAAIVCLVANGASNIALAQSTPQTSPLYIDQTPYYGIANTCSASQQSCRSYQALEQHKGNSYPNLSFFLGFDGARASADIPPPPTFVPTCSTSGVNAPGNLVTRVNEPPATSLSKEAALAAVRTETLTNVRVALRDLEDLVYRLRACDYYASVFAWNTRLRAHDAVFDYSWLIGCNSFLYEQTADQPQGGGGITMSGAITSLSVLLETVLTGKDPLTGKAVTADQAQTRLEQFLLDDYEQYATLYDRVDSCSSVVGGLSYPPNTKRFFCNYSGFIGALLAADAAAFGSRWGGSATSAQSDVTSIGTVLLAIPSLCAGGSAASTGKGASSSSGSSSAKSSSSKP